MRIIGGFFELELNEKGRPYHEQAIALKNGRACLNYILSLKSPRKIYLPFYSCNSLLEPVVNKNVSFEFYSINLNFEIENLPNLKKDELILYTNFFGIKNDYITTLIRQYGNKLILDNTHSFFTKLIRGCMSFNSARKYFGVPDGAYLYMPEYLEKFEVKDRNTDISIKHNVSRMLGLQEAAFKEYQNYESTLDSNVESISILSEHLLSNINYSDVRAKRRKNFSTLNALFKDLNQLKFKDDGDPFCYPLLLKEPIVLEVLHSKGIFIPVYWRDVLNRDESDTYTIETYLTESLLPLPIDHRYDESDMEHMVSVIKKCL